jgi:hypothetical protein
MAAYSWTGSAGDGNLGSAGNYSPTSLPGTSDALDIPSGLSSYPTGGTSLAGSVTVEGQIRGGVWVGSIEFESGSSVSATYATFVGPVTVDSGASIGQGTFASTRALTNHGTIGGGNFYCYSPVSNYGTITGGFFAFSGLIQNHSGSAISGGTFIASNPSTAEFSTGATITGGSFDTNFYAYDITSLGGTAEWIMPAAPQSVVLQSSQGGYADPNSNSGTLSLPKTSDVLSHEAGGAAVSAWGIGGDTSNGAVDLTNCVNTNIVSGHSIAGVSGNQVVPAAANVVYGISVAATTGSLTGIVDGAGGLHASGCYVVGSGSHGWSSTGIVWLSGGTTPSYEATGILVGSTTYNAWGSLDSTHGYISTTAATQAAADASALTGTTLNTDGTDTTIYFGSVPWEASGTIQSAAAYATIRAAGEASQYSSDQASVTAVKAHLDSGYSACGITGMLDISLYALISAIVFPSASYVATVALGGPSAWGPNGTGYGPGTFSSVIIVEEN